MEGFEVETVLVPVAATEESWTAAEYAVAVAERYDAALHVLDVLGEEASRAVAAGEADALVAGHQTFVDDVVDRAAASGVEATCSMSYGFSTARKTQHPGSVVLDVAEDLDVDFVVIPREDTGGGPPSVLEKAAEYVLLYASQPVLSV